MLQQTSAAAEGRAETLFGEIAHFLAPSLFALRDDNPDELSRQLQYLPTDFLHRFSKRDALFTPYTVSADEKAADAKDSSGEKKTTAVEAYTYTAAPSTSLQSVSEVRPVRTAISFGFADRETLCQQHLFEMSTLAVLLQRPREDFAHSIFWCSFMEKLEEFDFMDFMQSHIAKIWSAIKEQKLTGFRALRVLSLSCEVLLLFSEHAWRATVSVESLSELVRMSSEMWAASTTEIRRCAVVLSIFAVNFAHLLPTKELCDKAEVIDAPYLFVVLAHVPVLHKESKEDGDLLRQALGIVFATSVYAIPVATLFRSNGARSAVSSIVKQRIAKVVYKLFENVSVDFWGYFTPPALLSVLEAIGMYSCFWDSFPTGMFTLWQHIQTVIKSRGDDDTYALSLFNYYTAAAVYHFHLSELNNLVNTFSSAQATIWHDSKANKKAQGMLDEESAAFGDGVGSDIAPDTSLVKKTMNLLSTGWRSMCVSQSVGADKSFFHSSLYLFHALLATNPHNLSDVDDFMGCSASLLLQQLITTLLSEHVYDASLIETLYGTAALFQDLLSNAEHLALLLLLPDELNDFGRFSDVALLQLQLFASFMASRSDIFRASRLIDAVMHIPRGAMLHFFTGLTLFTQWLRIVDSAFSCGVESLTAVLSDHMTSEYFIHWLCEGMYVLLGEAQAGITFIGATPTVTLLEKTLRLLSEAVLINRLTDSLATCVISTDGGNRSLSACFVLFSIVFATNATTALIEDAAGILSHVMLHSQAKLFNTMRLHTATATKQELSATLLREIARPKASSVNVIRLACLHRLLCNDPPSFFYLVVSDESLKRPSGLQLVIVLREMVASRQSTELEKTEALEILGALHDDGADLDKTIELLDSLDFQTPKFVRAVLVAAVVRYVSITVLNDINAERQKLSSQPEQKTPNRAGSLQGRSKVLVAYEKVVRKSVVASCEALQDCYAYFNETEKDLCVSAFDDLDTYSTFQEETSKMTSMSSPRLVNTTYTTLNVTSVYKPLSTSVPMYDTIKKLTPLLLGDNFFLRSNDERCICVNRLASVMDATRSLTLALEALIWIAAEEREPFLSPLVLEVLESTLGGMRLMRPTVSILAGITWQSFEGWLLCARAAAMVLGQSSTDGGSFLQTSTKLNVLFRSFIKIVVCNQENIDVVCQSLGVLALFQPSDTTDVASMGQIFHLIADILEGRANAMPFHSLLSFITDVGVIYNQLGHLCPSTCAQSTMESLWSLALRVSHWISSTEAASPVTDLFDHILHTLNTFLLRWDGSSAFFFHERVVAMASVLGQFTDSSVYDPVAGVHRQRGWHRVWLSVLRLLHTAIATCGAESAVRSGRLGAVASLAAASPRFREAVSGFARLGAEKWSPFSWEVHEIHLCISLITLLTSFGVPTQGLTPLVRQCFCRVRRCRLKNTMLPEETPRMTVMDERPLESILAVTVRQQLIYLLQQPLPSFSVDVKGADIVTLERFRRETDIEGKYHTTEPEEQLSFGFLRAFIVEKLSIIRKTHREGAPGANSLVSPEQTPVHRSFASTASLILADADSLIGSEYCDWHDYDSTSSHMESIQLACALFVQYARLYVEDRSIDLWGRQELTRNMEKLVHALQRIVHDARNVENCSLTWVVGTVQKMRSLLHILQLGRNEANDAVFH